MSVEAVRNELRKKYIEPTRRKKAHLIGIEIEMPIVTLDGAQTRHEVTQAAFSAAADRFGFEKRLFDANGVCYNAIRPDNADDLSFDCSYNNLEISLGCVEDIGEAQRRFEEYVRFINEVLLRDNHLLTGMGVNPNYHVNKTTYIETGRYGMLGAYLRQCYAWKEEKSFHDYPAFGTFASASQVQLDVEEESLPEVLKAFSLLEPLKAVLFSNAVLDEEPEMLCVRDMLWEDSTHGINPRNVGFYDTIPQSSEELVDYILGTSLFCTEREGHYLFFKPIPASEYFDLDEVQAYYFEDETLTPYAFKPELGDLEYLRSYKHEDVTYRGTVEFRSCCCQPLGEAMTVAAFHVGLMAHVPELLELLESPEGIASLTDGPFSPAELRAVMNRRDWSNIVDEQEVRRLLHEVLLLSKKGLESRGKNEERFLDPLFARAESLEPPALRYLRAREAGVSLAALVKDFSV